MYSPQSSRGAPPVGAPAHLSDHEYLKPHISGWNESTSGRPLRVLSVGRVEHDNCIPEAFLESPNVVVSFATDYRELWVYSKQHIIDAVVIQNSLCSFELSEAARLVRARWPRARILIIRSGEMALDRTLYDRRLHPPVGGQAMVEHILNLLNSSHQEGTGRDNR